MRQHTAFENIYADETVWAFHDTKDPLIRFVRDRRIQLDVEHAMRIARSSPKAWDALVVCGGVGGEATLLANLGFRSVTVSDYSENLAADNYLERRVASRRNVTRRRVVVPGPFLNLQ
jgi:hypothetical protein